MNNVDNYNMSDFTREEIVIRDHLLRKVHPAPDVEGELAAFMQRNGMPSVGMGQLADNFSDVNEEKDEDNGAKHKGWLIGAILAVAASLAIVFVLHIGKQKRGLDVPEGAVVAYNAEDAESQEGVMLQKGDEEPIVVKGNQTVCAKIAASDADMAGNQGNAEHVFVRNVLTTPSNATAEVTLADGSVVTVNAGSKLIYPQSFQGATREVELQGEAYFKVKHDAKHPFIVRSNGIATQVLGTEFNVRSFSKAQTHVTLVQGSVKVSTPSASKLIKPGEDASLYGGVLTVRSVDTEEYTAWKDGEFYFDNESLLDIAKEIGKWYNVSVIFQSPDKMHTRLFFTAPRDGSIEELLEVLNSLNKAKFIYHDGQVVIE